MAVRSGIKNLAKRKRGMGRKFALSRSNTCSCHPQEYGLKKALRRARRRVDKEIVLVDQREAEETP